MPYRSERKRRAYFRNLDKARKKECSRDYYRAHKEDKNASDKAYYHAHKEDKNASDKAYYSAHKEDKNASDKAYYHAHKEDKNASDKAYYSAHKEDKNASDKAYYHAHKEDKNASDKAYYSAHKEDKNASDKAYYHAHKEDKNASDRAYYHAHKEERNASDKAYYHAHKEDKNASDRAYYSAHKEDKNASDRAYYSAHKEDKKASDRAYYSAHREEKNAVDRAYYRANREIKNAVDRAAYRANVSKRKASANSHYLANREVMKAAFKSYHATHRSARLRYFRKYHCHTKRIRVTKARYSLVQPTQLVIEKYFRCAKANLLADGELKTKLTKQFKSQHFGVAKKLSRKDLGSTVGRLAAKRLVGRSLQLRRKYAGFLLNSIKCIKSIALNAKDDFGKGCHTQTTEPYFHEAAYLHVRESPIPVNDDGKCVVAKDVKLGEDTVKKCDVAACASPKKEATGCVPHVESDKKSAECKKWECSKQCKPLNEFAVVSIVTFRAAFELSVEGVRQALAKCDLGCPNGHYSKLVGSLPVDLKGHPIVCYSGNFNLRILGAASTHFPVLRRFLAHVTDALSAHRAVCDIDNALKTGNHKGLMKVTGIQSLLSCDVEEKYEKLKSSDLPLRRPSLETELAIAHAAVIAGFEKEIYDFPENVCICCERLNQRKSVSVVSLSDDFKSEIWCELKAHVLKYPPTVSGQVLYMCHYCKTRVRSGDMPARCVLNGLKTVPIPRELAKLDLLSRQLIQRAKCYQTIVRLGTYTGKVPIYNSLQACKGTMFFLPLPLNKTLETLNQVDQHDSVLPDPELYIIVNGRPTKSNVVWRSLVNVNHVKTAIRTLRSCNWLYRNVQEKSIDEATNHIIEVSNNATTEMLKKVSPDEVDAFQAYTIRNLDSKLSMGSDIEQYRLMSITEDPISNKQQHLDVMCFPVLFPTGKFGEFHPREEKISPSEYVKSRLLNKDSRFRKDAQYVFYLL